jgi:hypothetical protein
MDDAKALGVAAGLPARSMPTDDYEPLGVKESLFHRIHPLQTLFVPC